MRFFKTISNLNWKYIIVEILLIFVGINLAIWFNNWNTKKNVLRDKEIVITILTDEISNNYEEVKLARNANQNIASAYTDFKKIYKDNSNTVVTNPKYFNALNKKYPQFFRVQDSVQIDAESFQYSGSTFIQLELADLKEIAWETTKSLNITNEFNYECLYQLESLYNLQKRVQNIMNQAADALQNAKIEELMTILNIMKQLDLQLEEDYINMLETIDSCK
jgi:hypothetical protein